MFLIPNSSFLVSMISIELKINYSLSVVGRKSITTQAVFESIQICMLVEKYASAFSTPGLGTLKRSGSLSSPPYYKS